MDALAAVDAELEALEAQLARAHQKKVALATQARLEREEKEAAAANASNDLQRQIDELTRLLETQQLEAREMEKAMATGTAAAEQRVDVPLISPQRRSTILKKFHDPTQPPVLPHRRGSSNIEEHIDYNDYVNDDDDDDATDRISQAHSSMSHTTHSSPFDFENTKPIKGPSEQTKQQHAWEKPAWALPSDALPDEAIQKESIQNFLLKPPSSSGYERKVHAAHLTLIAGKFVEHKEKIPDPRLVWIVVNIDGCKVGKIAMHLYGNFLPLTDIFDQAKGLELKRSSNKNGAQQPQFVVEDMDPAFYVHTGTVSSFQGHKDACFGVVFEGHDVVQKLQSASPESVFTIKQSHIYPVKKAK